MRSQLALDDYVERGFYVQDKIRSYQKQIRYALNTMFFEEGDKILQEPIVQPDAQKDTQDASPEEEISEVEGSDSSIAIVPAKKMKMKVMLVQMLLLLLALRAFRAW